MAKKSLTFDIFGRDRTASKTIRGVGAAADGMGSKLGKLGGAIGLAFGTKAIVDFGTDSVKAFMEAEKSQAKLADAFKRFPKLGDKNIKTFNKLNVALMKKTRFDDDATAAGQAVLAQYGLTGEQITKLTPLMQDYAAKTGKDLPGAALLLGKALLGQGRALKDIGVNFKDTKSLAGNFDSIMGSLQAKVGGFAEGEATQASVKLEILKNRFGEIQEKVGEALVPALEEAADSFDTTLMPALEDAAAWMASDGIPALRDFAKGFGEVQKASYDFGYAMEENLAPARAALFDFGYNVMGPLVDKWSTFWQGVGYQIGETGSDLFSPDRHMPDKPAKMPAPKLKVIPTPKMRGGPGSAFGGSTGLPERQNHVTQNIYPSAGMSEYTIGNVAANGINSQLRRLG